MLYHLLVSLTDEVSVLNVFRYQTTRTGSAVLTALLFIWWFGPTIISLLKVKQGRGTLDYQRMYQLIRQAGPVADRLFEIEFLDPGAEAFSFSFG